MKSEIFCEITEALNRGECAQLELFAGDRRYFRRFLSGGRLILLGCGHVALDVYRIARLIGFEIVAVDDRPAFANKERFPEALVICGAFVPVIEKLRITRNDCVCVMTRGHRWDTECVRAVLSGEQPYYFGMVSSRTRAQGMRKLLLGQGFPEERINMLHAPIGLPIGAMTTAEIAVSVCAELIKERSRVRPAPQENELSQTNVNPELLRYLAYAEEPRAMLVVLSSSGSTPVKSGSMMAVNQIGRTVGTIGGGCSEAAALVKARRLIGTGQSTVLCVEMTDDAAAESGMVCGGTMSVLIEDVT